MILSVETIIIAIRCCRYYFAKADVTKCYDSIDRKLLMKILKTRFLQVSINHHYLHGIRCLLSVAIVKCF